MTTTKTISLAETGTAHVWFVSVGQPAGCDLRAEEGEPLHLPGEDDSDWLELEGTLDADGLWQWNGNGDPRDFNGNTVTQITAFVDAAPATESLIATWDAEQNLYVCAALEIWSEDGDEWYDDHGGQPDSEEFHACSITLTGGPRDGVTVG